MNLRLSWASWLRLRPVGTEQAAGSCRIFVIGVLVQLLGTSNYCYVILTPAPVDTVAHLLRRTSISVSFIVSFSGNPSRLC